MLWKDEPCPLYEDAMTTPLNTTDSTVNVSENENTSNNTAVYSDSDAEWDTLSEECENEIRIEKASTRPRGSQLGRQGYETTESDSDSGVNFKHSGVYF
jgi:IS5 family transposase